MGRSMKTCVNVLELFSGIGGMHYALKEASKLIPDFDFKVVRAIDISDVANQVYKHNFPDVEVKGSNICGLTPELLLKLQINAIFMSPPCQPFTRQGNQKDISDNRSEPFLHIVQELLPNVNSLNYLLVENVKGFENSKAHEILVKTLGDCGFKYQEFLLCPKQLGIPNSRLRYYLIASKSEHFHQGNQIISDVSNIDTQIIKMFQRTETNLESYILNKDDPFDINQVLVDGKVLEKHAEVLDIVQAESVKSCCFTKSYGKYAEGTGEEQIHTQYYTYLDNYIFQLQRVSVHPSVHEARRSQATYIKTHFSV